MLDFIAKLIERYQSVARHGNGQLGGSFDDILASLTLAEAGLLMQQIDRDSPQRKPQIAVIGPTQAGKSTIVNLLLDRPLAGVSALAGFTAHPQAFCVKTDPEELAWVTRIFPGYERRSLEQLPSAPYQAYAVTRAGEAPLPPCVIWDTPDFDSIDSSGYRDAVLRTSALADLLLLVVSRDKYADQRVWDTLKLLYPLGQPMVVCINKLTPESHPVILDSFRNHLREAEIPPDRFPICTLPYRKNLDQSGLGIDAQGVAALRTRLEDALPGDGHNDRLPHLYRFVELHWPEWVNPIVTEHSARRSWDEMVEHAVERAQSDYRRDYLDHPQNYTAFQQAIAELLTLLEIPVLADSLNRARQVITWPLRQLMSAGKTLFGKEEAHAVRDSNQEQLLLNQLCHHTLVHLTEEALRLSETESEQETFWRSVAQTVRTRRPGIEQQFMQKVAHYQESFQPEIERSANRLYEQLKQQPATLNSLRVARVTTDAAAIVLAVKTGGLSAHDLVIAPAMLSLTSMLAESTLGRYMDKIAAELKQRQLEMVSNQLLVPLQQELVEVKRYIDPAQQFNIPPGELAEAEQELKEHIDGN